MEINKKIYDRRKELGLSLDAVSKIVGVNKTTILKWESGQIGSIKQSKIELLAKALKVPPSYLIFPEETLTESILNDSIIKKESKSSLDSAISSVCSSLSEEKKTLVLDYAIKLLKE